MTSKLSITQKPLSAAELGQKREALTGQIASNERQFRHHTWMLAAIAATALVASIAGNAHWGWLPWAYFAVVAVYSSVASVASVASAVSAISSALAALSALLTVACVISVIGSATVVVDDLVVLAVGIVVIVGIATGIAVCKWASKQRDRIEQAKAALAALSDADRAVCLEIRDWLTDETIRQYRDWVQEEGRVFTLGEVEAMRAYWDARDKRQAEAERSAAIDAACREVYVESLVNQ